MIRFLKLIRLPNLIIIIITQYAMRWGVIFPILDNFPITKNGETRIYRLPFILQEWQFALLVLSTVCIAAAGYIINDYFDIGTDYINKPGENYVGSTFSKKFIINLYLFLNLIGIALPAYLSYTFGAWKLVFVFFLIAGLLWYYSELFKRQLLIGNFIISILAAMVPVIVGAFHLLALNKGYKVLFLDYQVTFYHVFYWCAGFGAFAFLATFAREIIKDIEDLEGDRSYGMNTLPLFLGVNASKVVVTVIFATIMVSLYIIHDYWLYDIYSSFWFILLGIYFTIVTIVLYFAIVPKQYKLVSLLTKVGMLLGISYAGIVYYLYQNQLMQ